MNSTKVQNPRHKMQVALLAEPKTPLESSVFMDLSPRFFDIVRTSSSQCACVTCARFYLGDSQSLYIRSLLYEYRHRLRRRRERERERRARESVHRHRLCDQESARLQRPPRKGRPARRRVRDRAI